MTNRHLTHILKDQKPLVLNTRETIANACRAMRHRGVGSVLVVDDKNCLKGIFTGRDAVRLLAKGTDAEAASLASAMTRSPVVITPNSQAIDALRAMAKAGCRHIPVIDGNTIYGVVSRRDFKGMELEEFIRQQSGAATHAPLNRNVSDAAATAKPLIVSPTKTVGEACRTMRRRKAGCALIVDNHDRLIGIFTGRDAVRAIAERKSASARVSSAMSRKPITIAPDRHAVEALRTMSDCGFRHLPVVDNHKILGVVTRNDFTALELDRLDEEEHLKECIW